MNPVLASQMGEKLLPTTVVGSYPQPDWLVDRELLNSGKVPRARMAAIWRVPEPLLQEAQDDATIVAIRDMERAGIDVITDGEIRRESYSNRFVTALAGIDQEPILVTDLSGTERLVPHIVGPIQRTRGVEVRDMEFLRQNTQKIVKMTLPGPFTMAKTAKDDFYDDEDNVVMDLAAAVNEEAHALVAAGADVIQVDEPWLRFDPDGAARIAVTALNRALYGLKVPTVVHLCFGYAAMVQRPKPSAYTFLPQLADTIADQISIESAQPRLDLGVLRELAPKKVILGVINLADPVAETAEQVAERIGRALRFIEADRLIPGPDCGMKYLSRPTAFAKLRALAAGTAAVREKLQG
jgi:5-methyltetrahydropteroyltriglutamate--homocysteine methyltransferase